jgi:hypothetical protein
MVEIGGCGHQFAPPAKPIADLPGTVDKKQERDNGKKTGTTLLLRPSGALSRSHQLPWEDQSSGSATMARQKSITVGFSI